MLSDHELHPQDELLIAVVLSEYARKWGNAEPANTWELCVAIIASHGLKPTKAILQLE